MRHLLKPLSFLPAILMMYVIFSFSAADGVESASLSYEVSVKAVEVVNQVADKHWTQEQINYYADRIHHYVRKCAHMTEYAVLAIAVSFPLYVYGMHGLLLMFVAGCICVAFAAGDEYHQLFVAGRSGSVRDVCIDSIGVFAGIIFVRIIGFIGRKTVFRTRPKKHRRRHAYY